MDGWGGSRSGTSRGLNDHLSFFRSIDLPLRLLEDRLSTVRYSTVQYSTVSRVFRGEKETSDVDERGSALTLVGLDGAWKGKRRRKKRCGCIWTRVKVWFRCANGLGWWDEAEQHSIEWVFAVGVRPNSLTTYCEFVLVIYSWCVIIGRRS